MDPMAHKEADGDVSRRRFFTSTAAASAGLALTPSLAEAVTHQGTPPAPDGFVDVTITFNGRRVLSCLTLAAAVNGKKVTTVEGLEHDGELHPVQEAFIECDGFQCGFCTSGQIMSAVALLREGRARTDDEVREAMSGNICRRGAYANIVDAVQQAHACGKAI